MIVKKLKRRVLRPIAKKKKKKKVNLKQLDLFDGDGHANGKSLDKKMDELNEKSAAITPAQQIQSVTRGFRLRFGGLPTQRKLNDAQAASMTKDVKAKKHMLKQAKALFEKHPAITAVNSAKNKILMLFHHRTLPYPEPGVRLFVLETKHINFQTATEEEIDREFARQIDSFMGEIRELITLYEGEVAKLQIAWPSVLEEAKESLQEFYNADDYPVAEGLKGTLMCQLRPYNTDLPKEYGYVSPVERQRALQAYEAQFKEAVQMQEEFVTKLLTDAIDQMIGSITGFHNKEQRSFKTSVVERVFNAFEEFKTKTVRFGILKNTAIQAEFDRALQFMTDGGLDKETMPDILRRSEDKRKDLVEKMGMVKDSLVNLAEKRKRRVLVAD